MIIIPPPSVLEVKSARDVAVEFTSLSKTFSMPGWRMGFAVGNSRLIEALTRIKSYLEYGAFTPIQVAATAALNGSSNYIDEIRNIYKARRDTLINSMKRAGWDIPSPPATMFAWAPLPREFENVGSMVFSKILLQEGSVAVAPGIGFGEYGEGYVRLGLVENEHRIRQASRNVKSILKNAEKHIKKYFQENEL
jgi:Aspartate/tyrosine/aromatic aminotransferase